MRYRIYRTSDLDNKPCKNAYKEDPKIVGIANSWAIEINTLQELHELINEVKCAVIMHDYDEIEIYDDYRE